MPDEGITQAREPARSAWREGFEIPSYDFDEQDLAQMQKHAFRTRRPVARLCERELDQLRQPVGALHR